MVAFTIRGRPIYWYGIMYLISFAVWFFFLKWVGKQEWILRWAQKTNNNALQLLLGKKLEDLMMVIILGVMIGARLGDVIFYNLWYYVAHPIEILMIRNGGMSFVGGIIGVVLWVYYLKWKFKLNWNELFVILDLIVFILPVAIMLGRLGNSLNQELYGKVVWWLNFEILYQSYLVRIYDKVDTQWRWNTNLMEWLGEWLLILLWNIIRFGKVLIGKAASYYPGLISGCFCIIYGIIRIILETFRDNPPAEYIGWILKSQILMVILVVIGICMLVVRRKANRSE